MATPPYVIATNVPADNAFKAQYPAQERTFRDVVNSWLSGISDPSTGKVIPAAFTEPFYFTAATGGTTAGPTIGVFRDVNPGIISDIGQFAFRGRDNAGNETIYGAITGQITNAVNGAEASTIRFSALAGGASVIALRLSGVSGAFAVPPVPQTVGTTTLGTANARWGNLYMHDGTRISFGNSGTGVEDIAIVYQGTGASSRIEFVGAGNAYLFDNTIIGTGQIMATTNFTVGSIGALQDGKQINANTIISARSIAGNATHMQFNNANGTVGSITTNGVATAYNTSSDGRLKKDHREFWSDESGWIVDQLVSGPFKWIADDSVGHGVIAQDAKLVFPGAVATDENGYYMVDYSKFVPVLLAEVKHLRKRVANLEASMRV